MHARIGWQGLKTSEFLETGDYYLITGTDFENGHVNLGKAHYIDKSRYDMDQKLKLKNGDILITKDGTIGKVAYLENLDKPGTLNAGVFIVRPIKKSIYKQYLFQYLATPFLLKYAKSHSTGGTIQHLNQGIIKNFPVALPSTEEQLVISKFLKSISKTITLHEEKQRQLEQLKKALLQKMFADETGYPVLRFKGFTEKWEQVKLSKTSRSYSGGTPKVGVHEYYDGRIPFIRSGEIASKSTELTISKVGLNNSSAKLVSKGDILYALYGATSGEVSLSKINGAINQAILAIKPIDGYENYFLMTWLQKEKEQITRTYLQGGQGNLSAKIVMNLVVNIPSLSEQSQIAQIFSKLDKTITLHDKKIQYLKQLKRGLLQKMFV